MTLLEKATLVFKNDDGTQYVAVLEREQFEFILLTGMDWNTLLRYLSSIKALKKVKEENIKEGKNSESKS